MKFELEPDNRNCPDSELLEDLRKVANQLKKISITKDEYNKHGRFCAATMQKRFGSWNKALEKSGLKIIKRINIPQNEMLSDLKEVTKRLGIEAITAKEYNEHGKFSDVTFQRTFGSWANALSRAGLKPTAWKPPASEEDLFNNMASVWEHVGRQPKQKDFKPPIFRYSDTTYVNHFGSWRKALEQFVEYANKTDVKREPIACSSNNDEVSISEAIGNKTQRQPSWRLRFLVMKRDNFTCQACGASPAKNPNVNLHIDHVIPWSSGGETVFNNLQTLCSICNGGKSNLS